MKILLVVGITVLCIGCNGNSESLRIFASHDFLNRHDQISYHECILNLENGEYLVTEGDSSLLLNRLTQEIVLSPDQAKALTSFIESPEHFETHGSNCGTYFDLSCFVFSRSDSIVGLIAIGCSFGDTRMIPTQNRGTWLTRKGEAAITPLLEELERELRKEG